MKRPPPLRQALCFFMIALGEVPGEYHRVVHFAVVEGLGRDDRYVHAGRIAALLERAVVDDEIDQLGRDAQVIEKGGRLGGSAEARDALALALELSEQAGQLAAHPGDARTERLERARVTQLQLALAGDQGRHRGAHLARAAGKLHDATQRSAVTVHAQGLDQLQAARGEERHQGLDGVVVEVLVVDRVEKGLLENVDQVGHFEDEDAIRREQLRHAAHHRGEVVDVRGHVVGRHHRCPAVLLEPRAVRAPR